MPADHDPPHTAPPAAVTWLTPRRTLALCALLLLLFATLSYRAACTKCATYDEVVHTPAGYTYLRYFDFRANPEHPPLWKYWAAIPWLISPPASANVDGPEYAGICDDITSQWSWGQRTLYRTPGNDADTLLARSRFMMTLMGVGCGAMLAWWAYQLAGPVAALVACVFYSLDPNFLAHASLVTNDVPFCLAVLALSYSLWRAGQRLTLSRAFLIALFCGVSITTKYTGVLAIPVIGLTLLVRALLPGPWPVLKRTLDARADRLFAAVAVCALTAVVTFAWIWIAYGLRWRMGPDPAVHLNFDQMIAETATNEIMSRTGHPATKAELHAWHPSAYVQTLIFCHRHRLLPDAFLSGLWFAYVKSLFRYAFLLGDVYGTGKWYYFPVAVATKTPLATLLAVGASLAGLIVSRRWRATFERRWTLACLLIPVAVLGVATMRSHMNIGVRHFFPVYVYAFVATGVVAAHLFTLGPRATRILLAAFTLALAAGSLPAYPDYLAFFNFPAGGQRGGLRILGDSNLDWGQDLPALARWQQANPGRTLHLAYFGTADPAYYHIRADLLLKENGLDVPTNLTLPTGGVLAVSATTLQGVWLRPNQPNPFAPLLSHEPTAVLGGSIYLYDLDDGYEFDNASHVPKP